MYSSNDINIVMERTGTTEDFARNALDISNGDIVAAIVFIENQSNVSSNYTSSVNQTVTSLKNIVSDGNVTRIRISTPQKVLINSKLSTGLFAAGAAAIFLSGPIFLTLTALTTVGALSDKITIEIFKKDGSVQIINKVLKKGADNIKDKLNNHNT